MKRKPAKKKEKLINLRDRLPKTEEEYLERLILVSERAITKQGTAIDEFFEQQAARLRKQLEELREKNGKRKSIR